MAYWGQALVLGPEHQRADGPGGRAEGARAGAEGAQPEAEGDAARAGLHRRARVRYTGKPEDRQRADRAYADAMRKLVAAYPTDLDARTLYAEALMDLRPWNYWTRDGLPYAETREVQATLEQVLASNPNHPGALHLWIHLWEPTDTPERAEAEADRLLPLMPGAGHIVHMPAHIYSASAATPTS